jgi:hypothetical protein
MINWFVLGLQEKLYKRSLKKILSDKSLNSNKEIRINPSKKILILFDGTENSDRQIVLGFANDLKEAGKNVKLLSFINTKGELMDFGMAVYNNSSINWYGFPKKHILELLESQQFDILLNLNVSDKNHLHILAIKAKADFKVSLPTKYQNDFTLIINAKEKKDLKKILDEINKYLSKLTI